MALTCFPLFYTLLPNRYAPADPKPLRAERMPP